MNVPNLITLSRLVLTVVCFACLALAGQPPDAVLVWSAFALFIIAAATDFVDGYLARRHGQVTAFGRVADPFADKVLICGTLVMLLEFPVVRTVMDAWFVVVILAREFLVTTIRGLAESQGQAFPAEKLGKYKMVMQCVAASALLTMVAGTRLFEWVAVLGVWVMLLLTVASGAQYVYRARGILFVA